MDIGQGEKAEAQRKAGRETLKCLIAYSRGTNCSQNQPVQQLQTGLCGEPQSRS